MTTDANTETEGFEHTEDPSIEFEEASPDQVRRRSGAYTLNGGVGDTRVVRLQPEDMRGGRDHGWEGRQQLNNLLSDGYVVVDCLRQRTPYIFYSEDGHGCRREHVQFVDVLIFVVALPFNLALAQARANVNEKKRLLKKADEESATLRAEVDKLKQEASKARTEGGIAKSDLLRTRQDLENARRDSRGAHDTIRELEGKLAAIELEIGAGKVRKILEGNEK